MTYSYVIGQLAYIDHDNFDGFLNAMNPIFMVTDVSDEDGVSIILLAKNFFTNTFPPFSGTSEVRHEHYFNSEFFDHDKFLSVMKGVPVRTVPFPRAFLLPLDSSVQAFDDMFMPFPIQEGYEAHLRESFYSFLEEIHSTIESHRL